MDLRFPPFDIERACIFWCYVTAHFLREAGLNPLIQAGTMLWPRKYPPLDPNDNDCTFGYLCTHDLQAMTEDIKDGRLPELHAWIVLPETLEIVDPTTKYLDVQCRRVFRRFWLGPQPPDYIWGTVDVLPDGAVYIPCADAIAATLVALDAQIDMVFGKRLNVDIFSERLLGAGA